MQGVSSFNQDPSTLEASVNNATGGLNNEDTTATGLQQGREEIVPTEADRIETMKIKNILRHDYNQYETPAESQKKRHILAQLQSIIVEWIQECGLKKNLDEETILKSGGKIFTFGSYKKGVNGPNSDIDTLVVAPRHIDRQDHFFDMLAPKLQGTIGVTDLTEVKEAFVPVIKMKFHDVDIDLLFARVEYKTVGKDLENLLDNNILRNCDIDTIRSLNGCRVTELILKLVPNTETFQSTLRCIKLWSKNRGIHSNVIGYLGGVAWAILVARVCQDNPKMETNQLLHEFFHFYRDYEWGGDNPVTLCEIADDINIVKFEIDQELIYQPDLKAVMPIITPAFPSMNSTFNVSQSTKNVMLTEFEKAAMITNELMTNKGCSQIGWKRLFKKFPFFKAYSHFIEINILSKNGDDHKKWQGFAEAKIKRLVKNLENLDKKNGEILEYRPYPSSFRLKNEEFPYNDAFYIGVRIKGGKIIKKENIDLSETRRLFYDWIQDKPLANNQSVCDLLDRKDIDLRVEYRSRDHLPDEVRPREQRPTVPNFNGTTAGVGVGGSNMGSKRPDLSVFDTLMNKRRRTQ